MGTVFIPEGIYLEDYCTWTGEGTQKTGIDPSTGNYYNTWSPNQEAVSAGISCCTGCFKGNYTDEWGEAMIYCKKAGGRLPNSDELTTLAKYLYNDNSLTRSSKSGLTLDTSKITGTIFEGLGSSYEYLWSNESWSSGIDAIIRAFYPSETYVSNAGGRSRNQSYSDGKKRFRAVCVAE